jgi:uncharacterized protein (UPF0332 family)
MPYNWPQFLELARLLQSEAGRLLPEEAAFRSAVSRAYYAAYNHACVYAEKNFLFTRTREAEDHTRLRDLYRGKGKTGIASGLDDLRQWRNTCDYDDTKAIRLITNLVTPAINEADRLIRELT